MLSVVSTVKCIESRYGTKLYRVEDSGSIQATHPLSFLFCLSVLSSSLGKHMLSQVGGHIAGQMRSLEGMVLDGVRSSRTHFLSLRIGKR